MLKKLAAVLFAAVTMTTTAAFAAGISGILTDEGITVVTEDKNRLILNGYDENGRLILSDMLVSEDGVFTISPAVSASRLRASFLDGEIYDVEVTSGAAEEPSATAPPEATGAPEATASPAPTVTPAPAAKTYPSIYEKQLDAVDAIAVISKVSQGENEYSETYYYVDVLYQGAETRLAIEADVTVTSASDAFSYMIGQPMSAFKKGDVVCFTANLSGKIKNVGFVYRPLESNIVTDGNNYGSSFERLISHNGKIPERSDWEVMTYGGGSRARSALAFGVVSERNSSSVTLLGPNGSDSDSINPGLQSDTIVYVCDMSSKKELSIEKGAGGIEKSSIPKSAEDDDGNIVYSDEYTMNYALLRVVDGTVTDAVIYANYNN